MADHYLEFEKPIQDIDLKIIELEADSSSTCLLYTSAAADDTP